jgi:hypothetical protein
MTELHCYGYIGWTTGNDWQAKNTGDSNGDSKSDDLSQNAIDGACCIWETDAINHPIGCGYVRWMPGADWHAVV